MQRVFVFLPHSAPLLCFPCWNGLSSLAPVDTSFVAACNLFLLLDAHMPSSSLASFRLSFVDYAFAPHMEMEIGPSSTKWCLDGYSLSWMRLPQLGHRHQLSMFRNAIARPSYAVCQMEHRFTLFQYVTPYQSQLNLNVHPIGNIISPPRLSIRMLFVVKLQISQVGHIRLLTVASNHPRRVFLLKLGFLPRFCFTIWEEF